MDRAPGICCLAIFSELQSTDIKYHFARLREAILDYRLEIGDIEAVREAYRELITGMERCGDFCSEDLPHRGA